MTTEPASVKAARATDRTPGHSWSNRRIFRAPVVLVVLVVAALTLWLLVPWGQVLHWATQQQRAFQSAMAGALRAIRGGEPSAIWTLCSATFAYGFVHALGPGHGKVLLGGAALASGATLGRMAALTLASSLAQSASAILLVGAIGFGLGWATRDLVGLTETWLAPASALVISAIGILLIVRGLRSWPRLATQSHAGDDHHAHARGECGCGHAHGPSVAEVQSLASGREAIALVGSIALRPCTGALFVLAIALGMEVFWVGCLAVLAMGLGTAAFNLIVASSGVAARRLAGLQLHGKGLQQLSAGLHVAGGALIAFISLGLALTYMGAPGSLP